MISRDIDRARRARLKLARAITFEFKFKRQARFEKSERNDCLIVWDSEGN